MTLRHWLTAVLAALAILGAASLAPPPPASLSESVITHGKVVPLPPSPYQADVTEPGAVYFVNQEGIDQLCGGDKGEIIACAMVGGGGMALPNPCQDKFRGQQYADLVCHEKGHTSGWSGEHPRS